MAFFNNLKNAANVMGKSAKNVINTTATDSKEKSELSEIKKELAAIEVDIENGYTHIGSKYVEYLIASGEAPCIDIEDTLKSGPVDALDEEAMAFYRNYLCAQYYREQEYR